MKLAILVATTFLLIAELTVSLANERRLKYHKVVMVGADRFESNDSCVDLTARMYSGDFFKGLEKVNSPTGAGFAKGSQIVVKYPPSLTFDITAVGKRCSALPRFEPPPPSLETEMRSPLFIAECGSSAQTRRLKLSVAQRRTPSFGPTIWQYIVKIESQGCLIVGPLSVVMTSGSGATVARFTANL